MRTHKVRNPVVGQILFEGIHGVVYRQTSLLQTLDVCDCARWPRVTFRGSAPAAVEGADVTALRVAGYIHPRLGGLRVNFIATFSLIIDDGLSAFGPDFKVETFLIVVKVPRRSYRTGLLQHEILTVVAEPHRAIPSLSRKPS